jgi:hypothetical protein
MDIFKTDSKTESAIDVLKELRKDEKLMDQLKRLELVHVVYLWGDADEPTRKLDYENIDRDLDYEANAICEDLCFTLVNMRGRQYPGYLEDLGY